MRLISKFASGLLLVLLLGLPVMACLEPEAEMTAEESACCEQMANQCGDMDNSSGHSCCTKVVQRSSPALTSVRVELMHSSLITALPSEQLSNASLLFPIDARVFASYSPPESPPADISVLRI